MTNNNLSWRHNQNVKSQITKSQESNDLQRFWAVLPSRTFSSVFFFFSSPSTSPPEVIISRGFFVANISEMSPNRSFRSSSSSRKVVQKECSFNFCAWICDENYNNNVLSEGSCHTKNRLTNKRLVCTLVATLLTLFPCVWYSYWFGWKCART